MVVDNKIEFINVTKKFGNLVANDNVNFNVLNNEVHALLGENGAGKSTLMSILFGLYTPTSGKIKINGEEVKIKDPREANKLKIAMLPQHFKLVDNMTVLENIMLGYELTSKGLLDKKAAIEKIEEAKEKYNINLELKAMVGSLPTSDKQKVELLKILWGEADILIFDEPTSILTPLEIEQFLKLVLDLKKAGKTILLITHKLPEIKAVADRVSIIRKGKYIKTVQAKATSEKELANLMVGRPVDLNLSDIKKDPVNTELAVIRTTGLSYEGKGFEKSLENINLHIYSGEILGIAAIDGNGQSELMQILGGLKKPDSGKIEIADHEVTGRSSSKLYYTKDEYTHKDTILRVKKLAEKFGDKKFAKLTKESSLTHYDNQLKVAEEIAAEQMETFAAKSKGEYNEADFYWSRNSSLLSHIPEDRHKHGLVLDYSVAKNSILQDLKYFSNFGILSNKAMNLRLNFIAEKYDVRGIQSPKTPARDLSGGNQQKLILGREIERGSDVLLAVHPTRGLDVGAIRNVYEKIIETRNQGTAVLLSSGELDEIMQVSDRIIVLYEGKIVSVTKHGELTKLQLGSLMSTGELSSKAEPKTVKTSSVKKTVTKKVAAQKSVAKKTTEENKKFIRKNKDGKWIVSSTKTGKALRTASTQKEALALAGTYKDVTSIEVKSGNTWKPIKGAQVTTANKTRLSAADKKVKGGK